ncbi:nucleotidyltransferase family protein [Janibacter sp. FSL W8-0316]|uniref:nucleotidyltransferase family protein n=1 Tax=Janibacter sp. FSL W8-0316 TaxID=2975325 RepID=UPI004046C7DE
MSEPLTLAEAVPLGTVHLQRLLADAGVRSLVIKGPAFVELGVRQPKQSNDIDLLIQPRDRASAASRLRTAGWRQVSSWLPSELDDVVHSSTWRHRTFPVTLDLHHGFSGLLRRNEAFQSMWASRVSIELGHVGVDAPCAEHALVIESLNRLKAAAPNDWPQIARRTVDSAPGFDVHSVARAAQALGAEHTVAPLVAVMGGHPPRSAPPSGYEEWIADAGRPSRRVIWQRLIQRAPLHAPTVLWSTLFPHEAGARHWADLHGWPYRGRVMTLWQRVCTQIVRVRRQGRRR